MNSIGLYCGEYGGRKHRVMFRFFVQAETSLVLWILQLSVTITIRLSPLASRTIRRKVQNDSEFPLSGIKTTGLPFNG